MLLKQTQCLDDKYGSLPYSGKSLSCQQSTGSLRSARSPEGEQHK